ncbi:Retrovirus-related Pol polyprotein from transposon RE1 [Sesamum angolense]|uniref:Retrovirus-related Pol polyprotein from transposon RE1 n=1 Tax=Sesamum angolense TaxID=2727404 RepID=A0AAE1WVT7_9LAMI|nr:Retrovirus-related Pol polyprotein from transposon RE1 [Sesamum angolense]
MSRTSRLGIEGHMETFIKYCSRVSSAEDIGRMCSFSGLAGKNDAISSEPSVPIDGVPVLRRSTKESRPPERYGFVGLTNQLDNDPRTYGEAMSDIESDKWLEAMKSEMDLIAFKARLVAKGYTQRPGFDSEETYSPVAMAKSIQILLAITAWSIYNLKQASRSWNTYFDEAIRGYDFIKNEHDPCVYKKISGSSIAYLALYVDDILLISDDIKMLGDIKTWLSTQFSTKDMGEASS